MLKGPHHLTECLAGAASMLTQPGSSRVHSLDWVLSCESFSDVVLVRTKELDTLDMISLYRRQSFYSTVV